MGNYKFRLSDMIPNAWFYKLKDTSRANRNNRPTKKKHYQQPISSSTSSSPSSLSSTLAPALTSKSKSREAHTTSQHRKSYYITRNLNQSTSTSPSPPPPPIHQTHTIAATNLKANSETSPSRKSSKKRRSNKRMNKQPSPKPDRLVKSTVSASCSCRATLESVWIAKPEPDSTSEDYTNSPIDSSSEHDSLPPEFGSASHRGLTPTPDLETFDGMVSWSTSCRCRAQNDDVIDLADKKQPIHAKFNNAFDLVSEIELPPILTKPTEVTGTDKAANSMKNNCSIGGNEHTRKCQRSSTKIEERRAQVSLSLKVVNEENIKSTKEQRTNPISRFSVHSPGLKLRTNSPRLARRRIQGRKGVSLSSSSSSRRSLSESCAVVKSSVDPQRDFRESMVEMIVENNIRASKDLEDLLACYLSLNADEYHDLIIKVFKQIWFDIADIQMK